MKKIISEFRKTIAVILLEHAMDVCPEGEFKLALAKFITENIHKMNTETINVDFGKGDEQMFTATLSGRIGTGKTSDEAIKNLLNQIEKVC